MRFVLSECFVFVLLYSVLFMICFCVIGLLVNYVLSDLNVSGLKCGFVLMFVVVELFVIVVMKFLVLLIDMIVMLCCLLVCCNVVIVLSVIVLVCV